MLDPINRPVTEVKGHSAFNVPASANLRSAALLVDCCVALVVYFACVRIFRLSPIPSAMNGIILALSIAGSWVAGRISLGATFGEALWKLRPLRLDKGKPELFQLRGTRVFQAERLNRFQLVSCAAATVFALAASTWYGNETVLKHPLFVQATLWEMDAYAPDNSHQEWIRAPFYYSVGHWPRTFSGQPVLYSLPYEKGPPHRFIGHIVARWDAPDVKVTFEGPRTPAEIFPASVIKQCMLSAWNQSTECIRVREETLSRHIAEMKDVAPESWEVKWFKVSNPGIPAVEQPQGIYILAKSREQLEERFILVTGKGTHQAISLERTQSVAGEKARLMFLQALRNQRVTHELAVGRAHVNRDLASIKLDSLYSLKEPQAFIKRLSEVQALLVSKISVEPKTFDAYFHLAGISLLLVEKASQLNNPSLTTAAKPMIQSALKYAKDIDPKNPRTAQIENIWLDARKYQ